MYFDLVDLVICSYHHNLKYSERLVEVKLHAASVWLRGTHISYITYPEFGNRLSFLRAYLHDVHPYAVISAYMLQQPAPVISKVA